MKINLSSLRLVRNLDTNNESIYLCPSCEDIKGHLYFNRQTRLYICHKCGLHGSLKDKPEVPDITFQQAIERLKLLVDSVEECDVDMEMPILTELYDEEIEYLSQRLSPYGNPDEFVQAYDIQDNQGRIFFPIKDLRGNITFWVSRSIQEYTKQRYQNAPGKKLDSIFGLSQWYEHLDDNQGILIICEGIFSALSFGIGKAVATLGKLPTREQIRLINSLKCVKEKVVCFDTDANKEAMNLSKALYPERSIILLPDKTRKDPNYYDAMELKDLLNGRILFNFRNYTHLKMLQ